MTKTAKAPVRCGLSGTTLKYIACITMLIDHIGASCIEAGILLPALAAGAASCGGIPVSTLLAADRVLRYTGRLAFPLFCFLLVEGFVHTHNVKGYLGRLVLFGILSEVPFDLAFFRTPFDPSAQNVYWTLALGVLAMAGLKRFEKENGLPGWQGILCAGGCAALALVSIDDAEKLSARESDAVMGQLVCFVANQWKKYFDIPGSQIVCRLTGTTFVVGCLDLDGGQLAEQMRNIYAEMPHECITSMGMMKRVPFTLSVAVAGLDELDSAANCWQRLYAICDERLRGIQISGGNKIC